MPARSARGVSFAILTTAHRKAWEDNPHGVQTTAEAHLQRHNVTPPRRLVAPCGVLGADCATSPRRSVSPSMCGLAPGAATSRLAGSAPRVRQKRRRYGESRAAGVPGDGLLRAPAAAGGRTGCPI